VIREPKMKRIGRKQYVCAGPECEKQLNELTVKNLDPFCSTSCVNAYYEFEPTFKRVTLGGTLT
jgi:hypothetical protein